MADTTGICPLTTDQVVELVLEMVVTYNSSPRIPGSDRIVGIYLYGYQRRFLRRIIKSVLLHDGARITGLWSRQSGKSTSLSCLAPALCLLMPRLAMYFPRDPRFSRYAAGFHMACFAPVEKKAQLIFDPIRERAGKPTAKQIHTELGVNAELDVSRGDCIKWSNGSHVVVRTASNQVNNEGDHFHLVIIDESQDVPEWKVRKEIAPTLSSTFGTMVNIGTANLSRGYFYNTIVGNIDEEKFNQKAYADAQGAGAVRWLDAGNKWKEGPPDQDHFEFPWEEVCKWKRLAAQETNNDDHLAYEQSVNNDLRKMFGGNKEAPEFRLNYRLLWHNANLGAIDRGSLDRGALDGFPGDSEWPPRPVRERLEVRPWCRQVAGLDFGKTRDFTVLTIGEIDPTPLYDWTLQMPGEDEPKPVYRKTIIAWYEIHGRKWNDILDGVVCLLGNHTVDTIVADGTGNGDPTTEWLAQKLPDIRVIPWLFSSKGNDTAYKLYTRELDSGRVLYAAGPETRGTPEYQEFIRQHEVAVRIKTSQYTKCEAPEGDHDDYLDSAMLFVIAAEQPEPEEGESVENPVWDLRSDNGQDRQERYRAARR